MGSCGMSPGGQLALWVPLKWGRVVSSQGQFSRNVSQPLTN